MKLGRGGLADIEWTVQLLQLAHGQRHRRSCARRGPSTRFGRPRDAGLLDPQDADALAEAWQLASHARNAVMLVRDRADDQLPSHGVALVARRPRARLPGRIRSGPARRRLPPGGSPGPPGG